MFSIVDGARIMGISVIDHLWSNVQDEALGQHEVERAAAMQL
jgi:citrate lyase beta subunit